MDIQTISDKMYEIQQQRQAIIDEFHNIVYNIEEWQKALERFQSLDNVAAIEVYDNVHSSVILHDCYDIWQEFRPKMIKLLQQQIQDAEIKCNEFYKQYLQINNN